MFKQFLASILGKAVTLGLVVLLFFGVVWWLNHKHAAELAAANAAKDAAFLEVTKAQAAYGTTIAEIVNASKIAASQSAALQKRIDALIKAGAKPVAAADTTIKIEDQAKAVPNSLFNTWTDEYHRFKLDMTKSTFDRHQVFTLDQKFLRSPSGDYSVVVQEFKEYDPETGAEVPIEGLSLGTKYQVIEQKAEGPGAWHLRGVAGIDHRASVGGGVQINPWKWLTLGALGLYNPKDKDFRGVLHLGYRLPFATIAIGPYVGITSKGGGLVGGGAATIEVTR